MKQPNFQPFGWIAVEPYIAANKIKAKEMLIMKNIIYRLNEWNVNILTNDPAWIMNTEYDMFHCWLCLAFMNVLNRMLDSNVCQSIENLNIKYELCWFLSKLSVGSNMGDGRSTIRNVQCIFKFRIHWHAFCTPHIA